MAHKNYYHMPTLVKEIVVLVLFNVAAFIFFMQVDALEWLYQFSRSHEHWELDELIPLGATLATSLLVFSYRRIVELGKMTEAFEQLSLRDPLTNILNRRAGQLALMRWQKSNMPFALIQIDIDDFKQVNDLYGQSVGDEVLIKVAQLLEQNSPNQSEVFRWLDDNFIIVTPLSTKSPYDLASEVMTMFDREFTSSISPITCCIGMSMSQDNESLADLLERVEDALMNAKSQGKNKIKAA